MCRGNNETWVVEQGGRRGTLHNRYLGCFHLKISHRVVGYVTQVGCTVL